MLRNMLPNNTPSLSEYFQCNSFRTSFTNSVLQQCYPSLACTEHSHQLGLHAISVALTLPILQEEPRRSSAQPPPA